MYDTMNSMKISIGILSWNRLDILRQTLNSYKDNRLFDLSDDITIFFQEIGKNEISLAKEFGIKYIGNSENVGIQEGYKALVNNAKNKYFLFLENDWFLIEKFEVVQKRILAGISILNNNIANVVRYRHRGLPGYPCTVVTKNRGRPPGKISKKNLSCIPMIDENLCQFFPEIEKINLYFENYYLLSAKNVVWTNNPCLFITDFIKNIININFDTPSVCKINKKYNVPYKKISLEGDLSSYWSKTDFVSACSPGLFTHLDYLESNLNRKKYNNTLVKVIASFIPNTVKRKAFRAKYSRV